ncbi:hypothetical protein Q9295_10185 [Xinfangfangia sp. CPCC 101601]|uniref:Large polyvalent protein associated domain-containing protein n=1 Tax=Pseudogemmobacter lacusdianii TaxID=3069608 RepID=A0ABU0VYA8_9RHOB|nr:hypothetical protein [Xinfangfangia sp. CPCC 101601]MDQ2066746.1 hypothetical protein [Xinfangfangia sp. CPCC 101601]
MTLEEQKAQALAEAQAKLKARQASVTEAPEADTSFLGALSSGLDQPLENIGITLEALGMESAGGALRGITDQPENYESAMTGLYNEGGTFYDLSYLPRAAVEQLGQWGGSLASRAAGAGVGAAVGGASSAITGPGAIGGAGVGAAVGAFAGPALFEGMQILGPTAIERARNNGREKPNSEDWSYAFATAGASGALNALAPGSEGILRRMLIEGVTEGGQSIIQQTGETAGTDKGLDIDLRQAGAEAIAGAGSAGMFDATVAGATAVKDGVGNAVGAVSDKIRYDNRDFSEDEVRAADRLWQASDQNMDVLGNVDDVGEGTAKGAANAALREVRAEASTIATSLRSLAAATGNREGKAAVDAVMRTLGHQGSPTPTTFVSKLEQYFPNEPDVKRLASLAKQANTIQDFTLNGTRDMGGLSQFTRNFDITDKRNSLKLGAYAALTAGVSLSGVGAGLGGIGSAWMVNRIARAIDRKTNNRSRVKRFVDSVDRAGRLPTEIEGKTAFDSLQDFKAQQKAEAAARKFALDQSKEQAAAAAKQAKMAQAAPTVAQAQQTQAVQQQAAQQAQVDVNAQRLSMNSKATEQIFADDKVPEGVPYMEPYLRWQQATGAGPDTTLQVMEALAKEGVIPADAPQRFREDIRSFSTKEDETYAIQELIRQRVNPDHRPNFNPTKNPEDVLKKFQATDNRPIGDRRKFKAREGERIVANLTAEIEKAEGTIPSEQYQGLYALRSDLDQANMTRADRFRMMNEVLPQIFQNPVMVEFWRNKFTPLAAIGNDYAIERQVDQEQVEKEEKFEKTLEAVSKRVKKGAKPSAANDNQQPDVGQSPPQTTEDRALAKLKNPAPKEDVEVKTEVTKVVEATEPQLPVSVEPSPKEVAKPVSSRARKRLKDRVQDRIDQINYALALAEGESQNLAEYIAALPPTTEGRVEKMLYDFASDRVTVNQLVDQFAKSFGLPPLEAARIVNDALSNMEAEGRLERFSPSGSNSLRYDGSYVKDPEGRRLEVVQINFKDPQLIENIEVAKAVRQAENMVNQDYPDTMYAPGNLTEGAFRAIKDIPAERIDDSFRPILDTLNRLRSSHMAVNSNMLRQIEEGLEGTGDKKVGTIGSVLIGKDKFGRADDTTMRTVAQLLFQLGDKDSRTSNLIRQEWIAGANLRIYSRNGLAHSQAGDLMKGILRTPEKHPVGGADGLKFVFHGIGNLLGFDKKSPAERRNALFQPGVADGLIKFAEDPFGRLTMKDRNGNQTEVGKLVKNGEGFFQVLNAAHEVKAMIDFARARHKGKAKLTNAQLLQDPDVQADLAENYTTDFIVQLDASNNAYQIAGMTMAESSVLRATGLLPREGFEGDPDSIQGADIYLQPAKAIAERIPELAAVGLPDTELRKLFKKAIGTYLYAAEFNSREESFRDVFTKLAGDAPIIGIDGDGLINIPEQTVADLKSEQGAMFVVPKYDIEGNVKKTERVRKRVAEVNGKWVLQTAKGDNAGFQSSRKAFADAREAMAYAYEMDLYVRMNDELIRDMNVRYPAIRNYLKFASVVSEIAKGRGEMGVNVPTKDGMMLRYEFNQNPVFIAAETKLPTGRVVPLGVQTDEFKLAGRGLAALMTHQNDAWSLRETMKRLPELKGFNPIHDSYGFHPSDAKVGQETWVQVMQELGSGDYNLFLDILEANQISRQEFLAQIKDAALRQAVDQMVWGRQGVEPVPARSIPTALS